MIRILDYSIEKNEIVYIVTEFLKYSLVDYLSDSKEGKVNEK